MKKALALILSLLMVLALIPSAVAEGEATVASATLMTALPETGDRVVIHNTHYNKAMDACGTSGYYNAGVDITPADGVLTGITETKGICLDSSSRPCIRTVGGDELPLPENAPVSMNIFGFRPWMMDTMAEDFERFLRSLDETDRMIAEYPIPVFLDQLMASGQLTIKAQPTNSCWFGITYQEDADAVRRHLASLSTDYQN